jgi:hypothetical protein
LVQRTIDTALTVASASAYNDGANSPGADGNYGFRSLKRCSNVRVAL